MKIEEKITKGQYEDIVLRLNTGDGLSQFTTEKINGCIKAIILSNKNPIDIEMISELGYTVYKEPQHQGVHYFPLKAIALDKKAHKLNFQAGEYFLNEKLIISLSGAPSQELSLIIRYI